MLSQFTDEFFDGAMFSQSLARFCFRAQQGTREDITWEVMEDSEKQTSIMDSKIDIDFIAIQGRSVELFECPMVSGLLGLAS